MFRFLLILALFPLGLPAAESVRYGDWEAVQRFVADHPGKVVVVHLWTTTCGTCVEDFPAVVKLAETLKPRGVVFLSLNADYDGIKTKPPEFYLPGVQKVTTAAKSTLPLMILTIPFVDFLDQRELASTPAFWVYDAQGELLKRWDNDQAEKLADEFTLDQLRQELLRLTEKQTKPAAGTIP